MKKALVFILAATLLAAVGCKAKQVDSNNEQTATAVSVEPVKQGTIISTMNFDGNLEAKSEIIVAIKTPGKVISSNVGVGSFVNKGDLLFAMDANDVAVQKGTTKAQYDAAKASADYASGMMKDTKNKIDEATTNQKKLSDQMFAMADPIGGTLLDNPAKDGIVSAIKQRNFSLALTKMKATNINNPLFTSFEGLLESHNKLSSMIPELQSALKTLEGQKIQADGQVNIAKAGISAIDAQIKNFKVYAPITGVVGTYNIDIGSYPTNTIPLTIVNMDKVSLKVNMMDTQVGNTKIGDEVTLKIEAMGDETYKGKVTAVAPSPDMQTKTYPVTVEIDNPSHLIKPGFFVKAAFPITQKENTLYVPTSGVVRNEDGSAHVFVNENGLATKKVVTLGIEDNNGNIEVISGVALDEQVITSNVGVLRDKSQVFSLTQKGEGN